MERKNSQKELEKEMLELIRKYNAVYKGQLYAIFEGKGHVGRALSAMEKDQRIIIKPAARMVAANEAAYAARERGTLLALWVLASLMKQKKIEEHFLAEKKEYPIRIVFVGDVELYDILYVPETDVQMVNQLFPRKHADGSRHIVIVDACSYIPLIELPDVMGFCTVEEDGNVTYYRRA